MKRWGMGVVASCSILLACGDDAPPAPIDPPNSGGGGSAMTSAGGNQTSSAGGMGGSTSSGMGGTLTGGGGPTFDVENQFGESWIRYAEVQKTSEPPTIYVHTDSLAGIPQSGDFPDGTLIMRVEDWEPNDWIFYFVKESGEWRQNSFYADESPNFQNPTSTAGCVGSPCHGAVDDMIITHNILRRFTTTGTVEQPGCNLGGNTMCPPGSYD